jgi:microsomal dipeptidase-like Zn-dependent dipeptidase
MRQAVIIFAILALTRVILSAEQPNNGAPSLLIQDVTLIDGTTEGLIRRGYSDAHIRLILGANAMRVLATIWPR